MELTIKTSFKDAEIANYILNIAISHLDKEKARSNLNLSKTDVKKAKSFLKASTKALINKIREERKKEMK